MAAEPHPATPSLGSKTTVSFPAPADPEASLPPTNLPSADCVMPPVGLPAVPGYVIHSELARGGMGAVLRADDTRLGRELAVKVLLDRCQGDAGLGARFIAEAKLQGRLQHPGIVPVHELGEYAPGRPFFSMKLVGGRTLAALLKERPTPAAELPRFVQLFEQVCQAVGFAHAQGVIHRDLKPLNVMVGAFGEVQVMDWGLAKNLPPPAPLPEAGSGEISSAALEESSPRLQVNLPPSPLRGGGAGGGEVPHTHAGAVMGTPAYMAPEQARGEIDQLDARADVFGLGAILCEILTGHPPFRGASAVSRVVQAQTGDLADAVTRLDGCGADAELVTLARHCLAAKRDDRPADGGAVAAAVAAYRTGVLERLKAAEVAQAAAQARAEEEARTRALAQQKLAAEQRARRYLAMAAAVFLLGAAGAGTLAAWAWYEKGRADEQTALASNHAAKAEAETRRAEGNLVEAKKAVDACFLIAKDNPLFQGEENRQRRELLLKAALPFYRQFQAQRSDDPAILHAQADTLFRVGYIISEIGDQEAALTTYTEARELYVKLAADHPNVVQYQADLAATWNSLGIAQHATGRLAEAEYSSTIAKCLWEKLITAQPAVTEYQARLTAVLLNLGNLQYKTGRTADSELSYTQAKERFAQLATADPTSTKYQAALATTCANLGLVQIATGRPVEAERNFTEARYLQEKLASAHPTLTLYQADLANTWNDLATLQRKAGRNAEAERNYTQAKDRLAYLAATQPTVTRYQADLANLWRRLGAVQNDMGHTADAESSYTQARILQEKLATAHPTTIEYQEDLANTWNNLGLLQRATGRTADAEHSYKQAKSFQEKLATALPTVPQYQAGLAKIWNNLGNLQREDGRAAEAERSFIHARDLQEKLAAAHPTVTEYEADLASTWTNLGLLQSATGRPAEAERNFTEARNLQEKLAVAFPNVPEYQAALASIWANLGLLQSATSRPADAELSHTHARDLQEKLAAVYPTITDYAVRLGGTHCNLGNLLREQGRPLDALSCYHRAIAVLGPVLTRHPKDATARFYLRNVHWGRARALTTLGQYAQAVTAWEQTLQFNDEQHHTAFFRTARRRAGLLAGLFADHAWPLLWGWPR